MAFWGYEKINWCKECLLASSALMAIGKAKNEKLIFAKWHRMQQKYQALFQQQSKGNRRVHRRQAHIRSIYGDTEHMSRWFGMAMLHMRVACMWSITKGNWSSQAFSGCPKPSPHQGVGIKTEWKHKEFTDYIDYWKIFRSYSLKFMQFTFLHLQIKFSGFREIRSRDVELPNSF